MGIFSDRCTNPECGGRVPKAAKFCRLCGAPAANADTSCGRCGAEVATSSTFCWKCGANLAETQKAPLFGSRWVRDADSFAIRVDQWDVKGFLTKGLIVEHGTSGLVFQKGRLCGSVDPGSYDMNGFLKRLNNFNQTTPTSVVLADAGDVELHLEAIKLHSRENLEVDAIFKAIVRLRDPEKFFTNAFKSRNQLTLGYLANSLTDELGMALQAFVGSRPVEELYHNANLRQDVERQMQLELEPILERIGLEMEHLRFVDFFCPTYDPVREKEAELYVDTRQADVEIDRVKLTQRLRKSMTVDQMDKLKTEKDFEEFVRQTEHEMGIKDTIRADEMDKLKREFAFARDKEVLLQEIEIVGIRDEQERNRMRTNLIARIENQNLEHRAQLDKNLAEAENEAEIRQIKLAADRLESEQDFWEAEQAIELRKKSDFAVLEVEQKKQDLDLDRQEREQKIEADRLRDRSQASAEALLSILDGPAADRIARLEELRVKQQLTPDQMVAMAAAESPQVAQALAEKYKSETAMSDERFKQMQDFLAQQQQAHRESADRLERVMNAALQQMGATATTRAQAPQTSQTVVTPGGGIGGSPVVVTPQGPAAEKPCPKCSQMIPSDSRFCPNCSEKL